MGIPSRMDTKLSIKVTGLEKNMKIFKKLSFTVVLLCISLLLFTGCNNNSDRWYELIEEFKNTAETEVTSWLAENMPTAVLDESSMNTITDATVIYEAVEGKIHYNGATRSFMYSLDTKKMYIRDDRVIEICDELQDAFKESFLYGVPGDLYTFSKESCDIYYYVPTYGHKFSGDTVNRIQSNHEVQFAGLPYGMTAEDFFALEANGNEYEIVVNDEIVFTSLDSVKDLTQYKYSELHETDKPAVWLYALTGNNRNVYVEVYSKDRKDKIAYRYIAGPTEKLTAEHSALKEDDKTYITVNTVDYRVNHENESVTDHIGN